MAPFFSPIDVHEKGSAWLRALEVRVATWVLLIGEKMVPRDQINFEPPEGAAGELGPM
jgi:hypothetical protein